ncbi:phosphoribosylanthranilate isomerase [Gorillibacterium timonense]|uniref:phosphoribosylanthranilate isomerase n=1 Tax=Gorillibacterium timonense TaxID=1689269 RepID=UPI00071C617C|nr:phosphoribosylanthranilate isomerase [Gorillibacterium timonense]
MGGAPTVKICGIREEATLRALLQLPVDQIGFVFAKSRRRVTPEQAGELIRIVKEQRRDNGLPKTVGVFVEPDREELIAVLEQAPVDIVQLHSEEPPEFCRWIKERFGTEIYRVISLSGHQDAGKENEMAERHPTQPLGQSTKANSQPEQNSERNQSSVSTPSLSQTMDDDLFHKLMPYSGVVDAILLDTFDPVTIGGSGRTFPWTKIPPYREAAHRLGIKLIAAGGLNADNVCELLAIGQPDGVDVSGGVETDGSKDIDKIITFVGRVKVFE